MASRGKAGTVRCVVALSGEFSFGQLCHGKAGKARCVRVRPVTEGYVVAGEVGRGAVWPGTVRRGEVCLGRHGTNIKGALN